MRSLIRFSTRDLFWLTLVVATGLGWWIWWRSLPPANAPVTGTITVAGKPLTEGRIYWFTADGDFHGARIVDGSFRLEQIPIGEYRVIIEGDEVAPIYSDLSLATVTRITSNTSTRFGLHSKEYLSSKGLLAGSRR